MTGFGRGEFSDHNRKINVEIKSVNHRYLDINIRLPRKMNFLENDIRKMIKNRLERGKVDVFIGYEDNSDKEDSLVFNESLTREYMRYFNDIAVKFNIENDIKVSHLTRYPEVIKLQESEDDEEILKAMIGTAVNHALDKIIDARTIEGGLLKEDLLLKLEAMIQAVSEVKLSSPQIVQVYKEKLENRITDLLDITDLDPNRIAMEVAIFADKACVDEEIVRLESHITHMKDSLNAKKSIGRKLDFLTQEMNREANTILSKANSLDISSVALELKTLIEQIREQIQNIE